MKLLIVENERSIHRALSLCLKKDDHEVYSTESVTEGYYLSQVQDVDLIIIEADLMMPSNIDSSDFGGKSLLVLYDENHGYLKSNLKNGIRILQKPFSLRLFRKVIHDMLTLKVRELSA
jgi:DNA-binding NtrC family response regulator